MAKAILKHDPSLTKEQLLEILDAHFSKSGYTVQKSSLIGADLYVKKSGWTGVAIKLKQKQDSTFLRISGYAPSPAVRLLIYGIITILLLLPGWKKLENEVTEFVTSEQFQLALAG